MNNMSLVETKTEPIDIEKLNIPKILVVDDDEVIRTMMKQIFSTQKYNMVYVESSGKALESLIDSRFNLMLLDANLPGISGFELLKYCKKNHPMMEIIMVTGNADVSVAVDTIKDGAFDYITKPFSVANLLEKTASAIAKQAKHIQESVTGTAKLEKKAISPVKGFESVRTLGAGTMGVVMLVKKDHKYYAMKVLRKEEKDMIYSTRVMRFMQEAKIMKSIQHPNIVQVHSYGYTETEKDVPYIIMEYANGLPLSEVIQQKKLSLEDKVYIIGQLASALHQVHEQDVLHRDIKPGNVVITADSVVKLLDFGIARVTDSSLTMDSEILGSPAYMPPEAFAGEEITFQSDIFSLGILSYELLTGSKPFYGETVNEMMSSIQFEHPIEPRRINPNIPEVVQDILAGMLRKKMKYRYDTMKEILEDINEIGQTEAPRANKKKYAAFRFSKVKVWT